LTQFNDRDNVQRMSKLIARRAYGEDLVLTGIRVNKEHWPEFQELMRRRGLSASEAIRQMMADTIRKERARNGI
jgi:uncharacterized protein YoaH (UPF0181 family)